MKTHAVPQPTPFRSPGWRQLVSRGMRSAPWLVTVSVIGVVGVLAAQEWPTVRTALSSLDDVPAGVYAAGAGLVAVSIVLAAAGYKLLAFRRQHLKTLLLVELSAAAVNRLVPSGLGGLGVHGAYFVTQRYSVAESTAMVSTNNLIGIAVHMGMLGCVATIGGAAAGGLQPGSWDYLGWSAAGIALAAGLAAAWPPLRRRAVRFMHNLAVSFRRYERAPSKLLWAALAAAGVTAANFTLFVMLAYSVAPGAVAVPLLFVVYSLGVAAATSVPTPGGLGGAEAGLTAGLLAAGLEAPAALTVALAFRLCTYWLPIVPGIVAVYWLRKQSVGVER